MKKSNLIITILLFILGTLCFIFFDVVHTTVIKGDDIANKFLCGFLSRFGLSLLFGWLLYIYGGRRYMVFDRRSLRLMVWSLPCFMIAFVNFPYSALAKGEVIINRPDLIGLYLLYVFAIALLEELIFRGIVIVVSKDYLRNVRHAPLFIVLISATVFSLFHLTNLLQPGADVGYTLLQCGYTFLLGAMLAVTILRTKNIWLCIVIHTIFDFGGLFTMHKEFAWGEPWDLVFWILTIVSGVLCAGHIIYTLIKLEKDYVSKRII